MTHPPTDLPPIGAILSGPHWPDRVRVVRVEPRGTSRVLIEAVTLDEQSRLISRLFRREDLASSGGRSRSRPAHARGRPAGLSPGGRSHPHPPGLHPRSPVRRQRRPHRPPAPPVRGRLPLYAAPAPPALPARRRPRRGQDDHGRPAAQGAQAAWAITRTLIVAPANLMPQWQREMEEKFDEPFDVVDRAALNARDSRAWEITDQCVASIDFAWRADVLESLARAQRWDLVIVDEAHKMAAYRRGDKLERTRRYRLGEFLTDHTEHLLLLTATPHKGDPENFRLLLHLLDPDLFADTDILARAVQRQENPIFLRRLKEDMKGFDGKPLFPPRHVQTLGVELTDPEQRLYEDVTRYVTENFNRALAEDNRNVTFALIILQRRLASSIRAIRRSLENRRDRLTALRDEVRANPDLLEAARRGDGRRMSLSEDAPEQERWEAEERALRYTVARNLDELEAEIADPGSPGCPGPGGGGVRPGAQAGRAAAGHGGDRPRSHTPARSC